MTIIKSIKQLFHQPLVTVEITTKNYRVMDTTTGSIFMVSASNRRDAYTKGRQHFHRPVQVLGIIDPQ